MSDVVHGVDSTAIIFDKNDLLVCESEHVGGVILKPLPVLEIMVRGSRCQMMEPDVAKLEAALKAWRRKVDGPNLLRRGGLWGVVATHMPLADVRHSDGLSVRRVYDGGDIGRELPDGAVAVNVGNGYKILAAAHVMPGGPWSYRDEARKAKDAYVVDKKIRKTTAAEVWGYEAESHGY